MCLLKEVVYAQLPLKPRGYYFVRVTSERLSSGTRSHFLGRSGVGLANPDTREPRLGGKVVQFLLKSKTCYNSRALGHERPRSFLVSGYLALLGKGINFD